MYSAADSFTTQINRCRCKQVCSTALGLAEGVGGRAAISSIPCSSRAGGRAGHLTQPSAGTFPGFKTLKCTYMQGLVLPLSHLGLVSTLHRRNTWFGIRKVWEMHFLREPSLPAGRSAPGVREQNGPSLLWGDGRSANACYLGRKKLMS